MPVWCNVERLALSMRWPEPKPVTLQGSDGSKIDANVLFTGVAFDFDFAHTAYFSAGVAYLVLDRNTGEHLMHFTIGSVNSAVRVGDAFRVPIEVGIT